MPSSILRSPQAAVKTFLADEETFATTLLAIFVDKYGTTADPEDPNDDVGPFGWHPTTRRMELEQDFGVELPVVNADKLNIAISIVTSDAFYQQVSRFVECCNVLNNTPLAFGVFDRADADECAWGIIEAMLIAPPAEDEPFSEEIRYYIGKVLRDEGIKTPPDVLKIGLWDQPADYAGMSTDTPELFQAEFEVQADESKEIEEMLKTRIRVLMEQLESVPFSHGTGIDLLSRVKDRVR